MSVARPARCLFCSFSRTTIHRIPRRQFHASLAQYADRKPKQPNIKPSEVKSIKDLNASHFKPYTEEEKARISNVYSPAQIAAIEAGEKAINPEDLAKQISPRDDPWALHYLDDFSTIEPAVDRPVRTPDSEPDPNWRLKNEDELVGDVSNFVENMPDDPSMVDFLKFVDNTRLSVGKDEGDDPTAFAPELFQPGETFDGGKPTPPELQEDSSAPSQKEERSAALDKLMKVTGYDENSLRGLKIKALVTHGVVNQTRLGKIRKTYVLSVAGNGRGLLGIGEGKSDEAGEARLQSQYRAIRNMQPIMRYEGRTIYGDVKGKVGAVELELQHRPPGFGLRCQQYIFEMCRAAGIRDLAARVSRSRNPMNTIKATYEALMSQRNPEDIARARGKKLVDVRKVYYAGNMP